MESQPSSVFLSPMSSAQVIQGKNAVGNRVKPRCPLVKNPLDECYVHNMHSLVIDEAVYYCGGHFEKCEIYQKFMSPEEVEEA